MSKSKPIIINISFRTSNLDDVMLIDWLEDKFIEYGKSNYVKKILRKQMLEELSNNKSND